MNTYRRIQQQTNAAKFGSRYGTEIYKSKETTTQPKNVVLNDVFTQMEVDGGHIDTDMDADTGVNMNTDINMDMNTDTDVDVDVDVDVEGVKAEGGEEIGTEIEIHENVGDEDRDTVMQIEGN
jgi:hypothetical protein